MCFWTDGILILTKESTMENLRNCSRLTLSYLGPLNKQLPSQTSNKIGFTIDKIYLRVVAVG